MLPICPFRLENKKKQTYLVVVVACFLNLALVSKLLGGLKNNLTDITPTSQQRWPQQANKHMQDWLNNQPTYWKMVYQKTAPSFSNKVEMW